MLNYSIRFYFYLIYDGIFDTIDRITINRSILGSNKRIKSISQLKYPPSHLVKKYGRCNLPAQSVFYGTFGFMTALDEMKPKHGDLVTRTIWKNKTDKPIKYCPIFMNQPEGNFINPRTVEYSNDFFKELEKIFPENAASVVVDLVQFISDSFARRVNPSNHRDYIFSAFFSNKILHEFEHGNIDAIYYPSVQQRLSFENIAIKPTVFDENYELAEIREGIVLTSPNSDFKGYMMQGIAECKSFDHNSGNIDWENAAPRCGRDELEQFSREFQLDLT